jgi:hypothetical protein
MRRRLRVCAAFDPGYLEGGSAFDVIGAEIAAASRRWRDWPDVAAYDAFAGELGRVAERPLVFRDADKARVLASGGYDAFIHQTGSVPTRARSWHDFFNACIWSRFPRAKVGLHRSMLREQPIRVAGRRTRRQDWLTHLDECGVLIIGADPTLLELVRNLAWDELFLRRRAAFGRDVHVLCFGHAILEALREPFVGLMGKAVLCSDEGVAGAPTRAEPRRRADGFVAGLVEHAPLPPLLALPVLGVPGWHASNQDPAYYANATYFRARASSPPTPAQPPSPR